MTDAELEELLDGLDFELDPIFVIKTHNANKKWYVHHIEFVSGSTIIRKIYWTNYQTQALHFHNWDEAHAFTITQFGDRQVSVQEVI